MKNVLLYGIVGYGIYYAYTQYDISSKRKWLKDYAGKDPFFWGVVDRMTNKEVEDVYEFLTKYAPKTEADTMKPMPAELQLEIQKISNKYNIFT